MISEDVYVMNNLLRILIVVIALYIVTTHLLNENMVYRSVYIAFMAVCILALWVSKRKFGSDKILYIKAYIFAGWLVVRFAIVIFVGWMVPNWIEAFANGTLIGIVVGLILISNEFWS